MSLISIGDLAQSYMMRRQNAGLKTQMTQLVQELSSGKAADISRHLTGSYAYLADIDRNLTLNAAYEDANSEATLHTDAMQNALATFQSVAEDLGLAAMSSANISLQETVNATSARALGDFRLMVSALNTDLGGRALFSGQAVDRDALAPPDDILDALRGALAGQTDLAGVQATLDSWFDDPGGGFETLAYEGSISDLPDYRVGDSETVNVAVRADDASIRVLLKHAAMAALATDATLGFSSDLQKDMITTAGQGLTFDQTGLTGLRADLGYAQTRTEERATRLSAERTSWEMARSELLSVDPYEAATRLEDVQFQLEALYAVTARMARLSLTEYL